jgi:phage I-like protein
MANETLEVATIDSVPILRVGEGFPGTGCPPGGCKFTIEHLDEVVEAYWATKEALEPPIKLGHDENQALLQEDGFPAAGWVSNLRRLGDRLLADLVNVPKQVADLIAAGAYHTVSAELLLNYDLNGQKFPKILSGLALLGADLPAIDSLGGITALYQKLQLTAAEGATIVLNDINSKPTVKPGEEPESVHKEDDMDDTAIRQALGLDEEADIVAAINGLRGQVATLTQTIQSDAPEKGEVAQLRTNLSEAQEVILRLDNEKNRENLELRQKLHNLEAEARVEKAISAGRVTPALRPYALQFALNNSDEEFGKMLKNLPRVDLSERGSSAGAELEAYEPTESEITIARQMGNWDDADPTGSRLALMRAKGAKIPARKES